MQNSPNIITSRTKQGIEVWVSQNTLTRHCPSLSEGYLKNMRYWNKIGRVKGWRSTQTNGTYYYNYDTIPNKKPAMYASLLPTKEELIQLAAQPVVADNSLLQLDASQFIAKEFVKYLPYYKESALPQQSINLAKACAMLEWMVKHISDTQLDVREMDFFKTCCEIIQVLEVRYLPSEAYRNLKYKVLDVLSGNCQIYEAVSLPRAGNDYAASHRDDEMNMAMIYQLRSDWRNYSNAFIIRKLREECAKMGKKQPSPRWIGTVIEQHEVQLLTSKERYGAKSKLSNPYQSSLPTANALFAGDCWEIDGTRVNITPHKQGDKMKHINVIAVRDVHSGYVVGMCFTLQENRWSVAQALANAVANTGYLPYELRHDRFPGHNSAEMVNLFKAFHYLGVKTTVTTKATGKARLERWFGSMQQIALQESAYYYGEGITSTRPAAHRGMEYRMYIAKQAKEVNWNFDSAVQEAERVITDFQNKPYAEWSRKNAHVSQSALELHEQSDKPNVVTINEAQRAYLFGLRKTLKIVNSGMVKTEIEKQEFVYQITDFDIIKKYSHVECCYDVEDLSEVHLYAPSETPMKIYLGKAKEFVPVQTFGPDAERSRFLKVQAMFKEIERQKIEALETKKVANGESFDQTIITTPMIVSKHVAEEVESSYINQSFGYEEDDGEGLELNVFNDL